MPKLKLDGHLTQNLNAFTDFFKGAIASQNFGFLSIVNTGLRVGTLYDGTDQFDVPQTGPHFLTGTITGMKLGAIPVPPKIVWDLTFSGLDYQASNLFDLIEHRPTGNIGKLDEKALAQAFSSDAWKIVGSGSNDIVGSSPLMDLHLADKISGKRGDDILKAGRGNDRVDGGKGDDVLDGQKGNDVVLGRSGADQLSGSGGNDMLRGGGGRDKLYGSSGKDTLWGDGGRDLLTGGAGADSFLFNRADGRDTIRDFQDGVDRIGIDSPGRVTITDTDAGALIQHGGGRVLVLGIDADQLTLSDGFWT